MDDPLRIILSEAGLAGAFIIVLLLAVWKLYRDLIRAKDTVAEIQMDTERRYREALGEVTKTLDRQDRLLDRILTAFTRARGDP